MPLRGDLENKCCQVFIQIVERLVLSVIGCIDCVAIGFSIIIGDPGATSREDAILFGESLLQELKSPWELTLTEPVPEVIKFRPADWAEK